jgi:hypothetical protein
MMEKRYNTPQELIDAGREIIERDGWNQGRYYSGMGDPENTLKDELRLAREAPVCAMGALRRALTGDASSLRKNDRELLTQARQLLRAEAGTINIPSWNDHPERTVEDVLLTFKRAAARE